MRTATFIAILGLSLNSALAIPNEFVERQGCNRDNCFRAIIASAARPGPASASADCSSFFSRTVTPCPTTITVGTVTSTVTVNQGAAVMKRPAEVPQLEAVQVQCTPITRTPSLVPSYASACSGTSRYSSACSCNGIRPATATLAASTVQTVATTTRTTTIVPPPACNTDTFFLRARATNVAPNFFRVNAEGRVAFDTIDRRTATPFTLAENGFLIRSDVNQNAFQRNVANAPIRFLDNRQDAGQEPYTDLFCRVRGDFRTGGESLLSCQVPDGSVQNSRFQACTLNNDGGSNVVVFGMPDSFLCSEFLVDVVSACPL